MIRLNASHSKKVPGATEYSSTSFHASIEVEVSDADPRIGERLKALWADLVKAVDLQVAEAQTQGQARTQNGNGNGHRANGNGHNGHAPMPQPNGANGSANGGGSNGQNSEGVTEKQLRFVRGLAAKVGLKPTDLNNRVRELLGRPDATLRELSKRQASELIDRLREAE